MSAMNIPAPTGAYIDASAFHAAMSYLLAPAVDDSVSYIASGVVAARPASTMRLEG